MARPIRALSKYLSAIINPPAVQMPNAAKASKLTRVDKNEKDIEKVCYLNFRRLKKKVYSEEGE